MPCTHVAFNLAAPLEFTVATLLDYDFFRVIASSTAENRTSIQPGGSFITDTTMGSCWKWWKKSNICVILNMNKYSFLI